MNYTVTPFIPCNDKARAEGKPIEGWDIRDSKNEVIECFDDEDSAQARCAELNEAPVGAKDPGE